MPPVATNQCQCTILTPPVNSIDEHHPLSLIFFTDVRTYSQLSRESMALEGVPGKMDSTAGGVHVALVGRNSRCKTLFLKAAASSDTAAVSDTTLETEASWTSTFTPKQNYLAQVPEHGFSPFGERLLPARLSHLSAAEIFGEESKLSGEDYCDPILLVVPADVAFHKGRPRPSRGGVSPVKAAADRLRERFGGRDVPFAVALSIDFENGGEFGLATMTSVNAFISSAKEEMALEGVPVVAVTPRTELWLREQEEEGGRVSYRRGDAQFRVSCHRACAVEYACSVVNRGATATALVYALLVSVALRKTGRICESQHANPSVCPGREADFVLMFGHIRFACVSFSGCRSTLPLHSSWTRTTWRGRARPSMFAGARE